MWRDSNPELAKNSNVRDYATIHELTVLSNSETNNAQMIREGKSEETFLEKELSGYSEYKQKVKYRLIPFIW